MLKGYTPDDYYYEFAKFVPYLLDDAVIGTVYCAPAMTGYDDAGLLPFIAAAASNTTVLADGFADFLPTAAVGFRYEDVLTWKQVNTVSLTCHWVFPLKCFLSHAVLYYQYSWMLVNKVFIPLAILQALRLLNITMFYPREDGLEALLMNMTDIYSDLVCVAMYGRINV